MTDDELDALCDTCPHKDKINEYGDCSAPKSFSCPQIEAYVREEKEKKMTFMSELLSRCENSDDADKREIAVYVRKLEGIRDRLEKQLHQARTETTHVTRALNNCAKARGELAELKERYRWRKQSEEPAPDGTDLEVYIPPCQGDGINGFTSTAMLTMFRHGEWKVWPNEYWRPLDLPREEIK
jgi:hypothetical protein